MHCAHVKLPGGATAIVCSNRRDVHACTRCGALAGLQCDWKMGESRTCDRWICGDHALEVGPEKHLCPEHSQAFRRWLLSRPIDLQLESA